MLACRGQAEACPTSTENVEAFLFTIADVSVFPEHWRRKCISSSGEEIMLHWTLVFLVIALIAALLGFSGIAGAAAGIAKILFFVFLVIWLIAFIGGRRAI
jgi:uncharacterized membrane protein YtjA (UPF0391 family)